MKDNKKIELTYGQLKKMLNEASKPQRKSRKNARFVLDGNEIIDRTIDDIENVIGKIWNEGWDTGTEVVELYNPRKFNRALRQEIIDDLYFDLGDFVFADSPAKKFEAYCKQCAKNIDEGRFPSGQRFKYWDIEVISNGPKYEAKLIWVTQGGVYSINKFLAEVQRAFSANHKNFPKPFTLQVDISSRSGNQYGHKKATLQF